MRHQFLLLSSGDFPLFGSGTTVVACSINGWAIDNLSRSGYHRAAFHRGLMCVIVPLRTTVRVVPFLPVEVQCVQI
ncbi:hypothetical protein AYI69_g3722 [Smittium culicis]|uniref:Uncharacterized protein n=1 Tax=Smittium culicis TaxID=133412 RepID=A0A1R1YIX2_9FUNG|nr:hypothetical protein AYI69_g3722 [Smittium culicis]